MNSRTDRFKLVPAVYLILRRDNEVLLLQRANTGYQDGRYSTIAGHLDGDELATAGIAREAKEEAGITVDAKDLRLVHTCHHLNRNQADQERLDLFFEARAWLGEVRNAEPEKCDDQSWFPLTALPDNMLPLVGNVLRDVTNGVSYSEYVEEPA